jgi:RNA polymerase sigma-70 factor (ECF subfamily)
MAASAREIEELYRRRYPAFRGGVATLTGSYDSARDVVQEAFAQALRDRRQFRGDGSLEAWIWRIAFRTALRSRSDPTTEELAEASSPPSPERDPELAEAIRNLPPRRRLVLFLRYFADLSYAEISLLLEIREGTVAATLAHAHADLEGALTEKEATK